MNALAEPQVNVPPPSLGVAATVIVPAYNEEAGLAAVLQQLAPLRE